LKYDDDNDNNNNNNNLRGTTNDGHSGNSTNLEEDLKIAALVYNVFSRSYSVITSGRRFDPAHGHIPCNMVWE
jgi:hypothetical protein